MSDERTDAGWPRRLLVTLLVVLAWAGLERMVLPGVDNNMLQEAGAGLSVVALGAQPYLTAALLVELAALAVPAWRPLRLAGPKGRNLLTRATLLLTALLAGLQGWAMSVSLSSWQVGDVQMGLMDGGLGPQLTVTVTLMAGAFVMVLLAAVCTRHGLLNGWGLLLALSGLAGFGEALMGEAPGQEQVFGRAAAGAGEGLGQWLPAASGLAAVALAALATLLLLRASERRDGALAAPTAGLLPMQALNVPLLLTAVSLDADLSWAIGVPFRALVVVAVAVVATLLLYPRAAIARLAARLAGGPEQATLGEAPGSRTGATLEAIAYGLLLLGCCQLEPIHAGLLIAVPSTALITAALYDTLAEVRARRRLGALVAVWPLQRPYALPLARQALADEGIALHARSRAQRAMLQWLAPYIPIDLLVPAAAAERARELLQGLLPEPAAAAGAARPQPARPAQQPATADWRRVLPMLVPALLLGVLLAGRALLDARAEQAEANLPPAQLDLYLVADDVELPHRIASASGKGRWGIENVPLGPGKTATRTYAQMELQPGETPAAAWKRLLPSLEQLELPPDVLPLPGHVFGFDEATETMHLSGVRSYLLRQPSQLSGEDVADAFHGMTDFGGAFVMVKLTERGGERFEALTRRAVKRRIAIVVDGEVMSAPIVQEPISGGSVRISMGAGSPQEQLTEARELAARLRASRRR